MKNFIFTILFFLGLGLFVAVADISAEPADISYPVAELGNCQSEENCKSYCDNPENIVACVNFAKSHNMISESEAEEALKFAQIGKGPGGCQGKDACEQYCDNSNNMQECLAFAEEHNLMPAKELKEAKKVAQALASGAKLPGGCFGKEQCDAYCQDPSHMEECLDFAEKAGLIPPEELQEARRIAPFMKQGLMPGNCRTKEQCQSYCDDESHIEECAAFFVKAGFMSEEDAVMFRKTGGRGPNGCRSKESCDAFCNQPENEETCFNFGMEHGLISQETLDEIEEGKARMQESLEGASEEVLSCLEEKIGADSVEKLRAGAAMPSRKMGDAMKDCFENFANTMPQRGRIEEGGMSPEQSQCVQNITNEIQGPPSAELQQRIASECFGAPEDYQEFQDYSDSQEHFLQENQESAPVLPLDSDYPGGGSILDALKYFLKSFKRG